MKIHITLLTKAVFRIVEEWMGSMLRADIPIFLILREAFSISLKYDAIFVLDKSPLSNWRNSLL